MELIRNMVDARYKDTQADIKAIKEHLVKITGSAPTTVIYDDEEDDAKNGEKDSLRKLQPDSKAKPKPKPKVQQKPESIQPKTSFKALKAGKEKGIYDTINKKAEEIALEKEKKQDTKESKASSFIKLEQAEQRKKEDIGTSKRRNSTRKVRPLIATPPKTTATPIKTVSSAKPKTTDPKAKPSTQKPSPQQPPQKNQTVAETPVVSADVSQTSAIIILTTPPTTQPPPTPQRFPTHPPSPPKRLPSPKIKSTLKRKTHVVLEDNEEIKSPIPLSSTPIHTIPPSSCPPKKPTSSLPFATQPLIIPLTAQYPLELLTIKGEIESFFTTEDPLQRSFPSLCGYRQPKNLDDYLKLKAR
ncbi:serine/arginine repetitive matrix protein 1-like [Helianthus annuus]|uniref:serine/arginine repetitive matrix protein 1-like n=1 Tax=Helianthus annuus TaxID=4232 RepID=UPI000B902C3C|nr:serine/arginine repetitive matrix protein 1-like [Helianthus annuus]